MTRTVLTGALVAACAAASFGLAKPAAAPADSAVNSATGDGLMAFGKDGHGRGLLRFNIVEDGEITGSLLYAAEDHHHFPDVIVELGRIDKATFLPRSVRFSGPGGLHDDPVHVTVRAYDRGKKRPDRFVIRCKDTKNNVVFEADGELLRGDIVVNTAEGVEP
jgi:hypothetical protein